MPSTHDAADSGRAFHPAATDREVLRADGGSALPSAGLVVLEERRSFTKRAGPGANPRDMVQALVDGFASQKAFELQRTPIAKGHRGGEIYRAGSPYPDGDRWVTVSLTCYVVFPKKETDYAA